MENSVHTNIQSDTKHISITRITKKKIYKDIVNQIIPMFRLKYLFAFFIITAVSAQDTKDFKSLISLQTELSNKNFLRNDFVPANQNGRIFNDNLDFSNTSYTIESLFKISGELTAGAVVGYGGAVLMKNIFKTKDDNWVGYILTLGIQSYMVALGASAGSALGAFTMGKIIGDDGSFYNTFICGLITSVVFYYTSGIFTRDINNRFWIAMSGLPIGAVIGFNTKEWFE